ncbi:MAG: SagB/ThcOx family dehydrogenase [Desulfobacterales bacterium]|nr:MAG: SagB/ThcOx family dehydrogenase [Desulfobacterales bacterium]
MKNIAEKIVGYHEETKHRYERYARSAGYMDWDNQPNPFRFYEHTRIVELPFLKEDPRAAYQNLYQRGSNSPREFDVDTIAGLLELSLGLSAWKAVGRSRWSLRINPSSGNLHPTEAHIIVPHMPALPTGIYHYNVLTHSLEERAVLAEEIQQQIRAYFGAEGFLIGLSSIFWRESWKYGERAFRYCNHDVGHALAALSLAANLFGWKVTYLNGLSDEALDTILGFDQTRFEDLEEEHPDLLCFVHPYDCHEIPRSLPQPVISAFANLTFKGTPNTLSKQRINWEIIYQTAKLTRKPPTAPTRYDCGKRAWRYLADSQLTAAQIIRQRRSATAFDRSGSVSKNQFLAMLDNTLPRGTCAPFDVELMHPSIHLLIFVHHVADLAPGLYLFLRHGKNIDRLKMSARSGFVWQPIDKEFPLYLLQEGNFRQQAKTVSCHQDIAGDGAFSLGMIAVFSDTIGSAPYRYRQLFWETGMIGQVLYLEAEAHGVRGTGIGCFFDDAVHEILGIEGNQYQSLYHFTVGKPIEDSRLTTYPAYHHLSNR